MDDLEISHHDPAMVNEVIASLSANYSQVVKMTARRIKKHVYLGMALYFSEDGKFIFDIEGYLDKILSGLPEDMNGMATTPVSDSMFKTRDNARKLNKEKTALLHHVTAQILITAQRGRPDLKMAIYFLTKQI